MVPFEFNMLLLGTNMVLLGDNMFLFGNDVLMFGNDVPVCKSYVFFFGIICFCSGMIR